MKKKIVLSTNSEVKVEEEIEKLVAEKVNEIIETASKDFHRDIKATITVEVL